MNILKLMRTTAVTIGLLCFGWAPSANAVIFDLIYDDTPNGAVDGGTLGTGVLSYDDPLAAGTFTLDTLTNLAISISFTSGESFVLGDLATSPAIAGIEVTDLGGGDFGMVFTGDGTSSPFLGSADFVDGTDILTHEPTAGPTNGVNLYVISSVGAITGDYNGALRIETVPEPSALLLLGIGLIGVAAVRRKRQA